VLEGKVDCVVTKTTLVAVDVPGTEVVEVNLIVETLVDVIDRVDVTEEVTVEVANVIDVVVEDVVVVLTVEGFSVLVDVRVMDVVEVVGPFFKR